MECLAVEQRGGENLTSAPNEVSAESCIIDMAPEGDSRTQTLSSRHDYEEVRLDDLGNAATGFPGETRDHVYDEPDETEPGVNLNEARGYEEPVKRCWKRLSLPSLDDPSLFALSQMQRRNSSATELYTSISSCQTQAKKPGKILHYAEFSLCPSTQTRGLSSTSGAASVFRRSVSSRHPPRKRHEYEEPSFPNNTNLRQNSCPVPAPMRFLCRGERTAAGDYEIPIVTSPPLLRAKASSSVMRQVKLKLHHLSATMSGGNDSDEEVRLIRSDSEGKEEMSELLKSPKHEAFSSQDSNSNTNVSHSLAKYSFVGPCPAL